MVLILLFNPCRPSHPSSSPSPPITPPPTHEHPAFHLHGNRSSVGLGGRLAQNFSILPETFVLPKEYDKDA